jgi:hypothetical protein
LNCSCFLLTPFNEVIALSLQIIWESLLSSDLLIFSSILVILPSSCPLKPVVGC